MPADYSSTAKALALPISPVPSPSPERHAERPPWSRRISSGVRRGTTASPYSSHQPTSSLRDQLIRKADKLQRKAVATWQRLSLLQKCLAAVALVLNIVLIVLFLVYQHQIFSSLAPFAAKWRDTPGGWMILWAICFIAAFPPLIGYSSTITIAGFVYGVPKGWAIVASATVAGSLCSFLASRTILSSYVHRLVGKDKRFEALALTLKHDGVKILCMIRLCPLPYSLSNAAVATFPTVHPLMYALATAIVSPKLFIHVFIGSRLGSLASDEEMDTSTKLINYASIIFGGILGASVGYIIYQRTMARAKELEIAELESGRAEVGLGGDIAARRGEYTDGDFGETDSAALMNDDDISLWGHDNAAQLGEYRDDFGDDDDDDVFASGDADAVSAGRR
ncbi:Golgi apparatus membrane tvp38 protein [Rutstroemia sp. NJR-2017a WRK4]|nr:Golgi apparatus membrane tvp38 protein [Rutstroemia sp. NJR-2017a WRK4]